jgi:LPXTG-site transpeptidase (sortase) family protein
MAGRCPHLGLAGKCNQVYLVSSVRHRCYVHGLPERIGSAHQAELCLTTAHRRCPRLIVGAASSVQPAVDGQGHTRDFTRAQPSPVVESFAIVPGRTDPGGQAGWNGPSAPFAELRATSSRKTEKPRRPLTLSELVVVCLGLAILLAVSFIGYAMVYRLRIGPGMAAAPAIARGSEITTIEAPPTLAPTFTPTPVPTLAVATPVTLPPTAIAEPMLPVPEPASRQPVGSPPTRLVIPRIAVDIPVLPVGVKTIHEKGTSKLVWADVPNAGGFHQTSAYPGHPGNTVINGHRDIQGAVFRRLDQLETGDEITLYVGEAAYDYYVTETLVVPETFATAQQRVENLQLIGYMPEERLTLVTCTPVGLATHRLLVIARPQEQLTPEMPEAGSGTQP